jgi:tellurium resistance protein TerD
VNIDVTKGATVALGKAGGPLSRVTVCLGWDPAAKGAADDFDLDASVFALGADDRIIAPGYFVFFNNLSSPRGEIRHQGDNLTGDGDGDDEQIEIELDELSRTVVRVVFVVTIHNADYRHQDFGDVRNAYIRVVDSVRGVELARYDLSTEAKHETAMLFAEIYRGESGWRFRALGQGRIDDLAGVARQFGFAI